MLEIKLCSKYLTNLDSSDHFSLSIFGKMGTVIAGKGLLFDLRKETTFQG